MIMKNIESKLRYIFEQNHIAGMSVAITDRTRTIQCLNFGVENVEFPERRTNEYSMYRIASITKVLSGLTILCLVDRNILELDRLVRDYIPWLSFTNGAEKQMTLRHLLSHTSGLPKEYTPDGPREESALEQSLKEGFRELQLHSLPEDKCYCYSNWGIRLASLVAEKQTGIPFSQLVKRYVLEPLGMEKTTFDIREAITYPISLPHIENELGELKVYHYMKENATRHAAGGLYSSADELCKLARFLLAGGVNEMGERIVSEQSIQEMFSPHTCATDKKDMHYGITMFIRKNDELITFGHTGSAPPYATSLFIEPKSGIGVITLMNTQKNELRYQVPDVVFEELHNI